MKQRRSFQSVFVWNVISPSAADAFQYRFLNSTRVTRPALHLKQQEEPTNQTSAPHALSASQCQTDNYLICSLTNHGNGKVLRLIGTEVSNRYCKNAPFAVQIENQAAGLSCHLSKCGTAELLNCEHRGLGLFVYIAEHTSVQINQLMEDSLTFQGSGCG